MYRFYNLQSGSDHNISLSTIFVDDERFLKNYNLKIYFGQAENKSLHRLALFIILSAVITL